MKSTIFRLSGSTAVVACTLLLPMGVSAQSITTTGPDSTNTITETNKSDCNVQNDNSIHPTNNNSQTATSGDVQGSENTTVGSVASGNASSTSNTNLNLSINNSGACASKTTTTPPVPSPGTQTPPVVMAPETPAAKTQQAGGRGGEEVSAPITSTQQVIAPTGGVGAGEGGPGVFATFASVTIASALWFAARIRRQFSGLLG